MTQEYLNHLFANYPSVENFYWTADATAFKTIDEARAYSKTLGNAMVKSVEFGGKLVDAVDVDITETPLGNTAGEYIDDTQVVAAPKASTEIGDPIVDYEVMTVAALKSLCVEREIELNGATKKADIIALLTAADKATAAGDVVVDNTIIDYSTLDFENLKALCTERNVEFTEADDEAALIVKLTEFDANQTGE